MAKERKPEGKAGKVINLAREIPTPKSSLKTNKSEPPKKDDDK